MLYSSIPSIAKLYNPTAIPASPIPLRIAGFTFNAVIKAPLPMNPSNFNAILPAIENILINRLPPKIAAIAADTALLPLSKSNQVFSPLKTASKSTTNFLSAVPSGLIYSL